MARFGFRLACIVLAFFVALMSISACLGPMVVCNLLSMLARGPISAQLGSGRFAVEVAIARPSTEIEA